MNGSVLRRRGFSCQRFGLQNRKGIRYASAFPNLDFARARSPSVPDACCGGSGKLVRRVSALPQLLLGKEANGTAGISDSHAVGGDGAGHDASRADHAGFPASNIAFIPLCNPHPTVHGTLSGALLLLQRVSAFQCIPAPPCQFIKGQKETLSWNCAGYAARIKHSRVYIINYSRIGAKYKEGAKDAALAQERECSHAESNPAVRFARRCRS